jgi:hypothetical protein
VESIATARAHLNDGGLLVLYNYYRQEWSIRKLAGMLERAFGEPPFVTTFGTSGRAATFMAGPRLREGGPAIDRPYAEGGDIAPGTGSELPVIGEGRLSGDPSIVPSTDDWPFFYMKEPAIPAIYLGAIGMIVVIALITIGLTASPRELRRFSPEFFFLGAAFMLLEARSLVIFALLFGTTWLVNSLVFFAILTSVLVAILVTARWPARQVWPLFAVLFALLAANYFVPVRAFLALDPAWLRYPAAAAFAFAPVFVANLIFSREFAGTKTVADSFAYNLLGIMFGGIFEYAAMLTGYQALLIVVLVFYGLAFSSRLASRPAAVSAEAVRAPPIAPR